MFYGHSDRLAMSRTEVTRARAYCASCPVAYQCLEYALRVRERWGIWGGFTSAERDRALLAFGSVEAIMAGFQDRTLAEVVIKL